MLPAMRSTRSSIARYLLLGGLPLLILVVLALKSAHAEESASPKLTINGYAETYFQWNFNDPSHGITNYRGFDNRHDTFTISNVALDAQWDDEQVMGRLALQVGNTPSTYYLGEPSVPGASGANASNSELWKYVQQAYAGYRSTSERAWVATGGVFLSPVGPEAVPIRDNWNWSRSNLFFGLPFYHTGARLSYPLNETWTGVVLVTNGWNSVVDNNTEKSVCTQLTGTPAEGLTVSVLYFGGCERATGAPEGRPWRNLFDAYATWDATSRWSFLAHADTGFEDNHFGTSRWLAGALYARFHATERVYLGARVDAFEETVPANAQGSASAIFWPAEWVSSTTATIDFRPSERVSLRFEYRYDNAEDDMFFGDTVVGDGVSTPYAFNKSSQNTFTVGAVTWF
jgi:hypothetical protein